MKKLLKQRANSLIIIMEKSLKRNGLTLFEMNS